MSRCLALLLKERLRLSNKSVWPYVRDFKLQVYIGSPTSGKIMDFQVVPEVQSKAFFFYDLYYWNQIILYTVLRCGSVDMFPT